MVMDPPGPPSALWVVHHDYSGFGRSRVIPSARLEEAFASGVTFSRSAWDYLYSGVQVPDPGFGADSGDYEVVPDPTSLVRLPHVPDVDQVFADLRSDGVPWDGDPRGRLRAAVADLATLGITAKVAFETEFTVLREEAPGRWAPVEREPMFSVTALEGQWPVWIGRTLGGLAAAGVPLHQLTREGSPGQYEVSILPSDPVTACDRFLLARQIVKGMIARPLVASFMPKPYADLAGNGVHVHVSLFDTSDRPILQHPSAPGQLSDTGIAIVSALLDHAPAQCALGSPTPNSFARLRPGTGAPARVSWGHGNRSTLIRIPGPGAARRIEHRGGDAGANPYLLLLGLIATITRGLRAPGPSWPPQSMDLDHVSDARAEAAGALALPRHLGEALDALEQDEVLLAALGPTIAPHYLAYKRCEAAVRARGAADHPDGELAWDRESLLVAM